MANSLASVRETMRRSRVRAQHELAQREHTLIALTAAAALGLAEAKGHRLPQVFGIDGTIVFGVVSVFAAEAMGGGMGRTFQSVGDGLLCIGSYKMGRAVGGMPIQGIGSAGADDVRAFEAHLSADAA